MVATLKSKLSIDSKPDTGTVVKVRVPVQPGAMTGDNS
jgi:hypothetical protein